jgi:DNA-binding beta-propeller fold protein YncE
VFSRRIVLASLAIVAPLAAACVAASLVACANSTSDKFDPNAAAAPSDGGTAFSTEAGRPNPSGAGEVFGHSENTLYRVDTVTRSVTQIGVFEGCTYVADIALDESSNIYASTGAELFFVETNTAHCTRIAAGTFPNSLSFVPAGTVEPDREALVGFQGGDYVKIDPASGAVTKIGQIGSGLESSGDVVSAKGGKTFVTVKGKDCADCLVEIDPATGALTKNWGPIGKTDVFGLAFWAGDLYGFTNAGELILITLTSGALQMQAIPVTDAPAKFWGAGSTTSAPIGPVR